MVEHRIRAGAREPAAESEMSMEQDHLLGCAGVTVRGDLDLQLSFEPLEDTGSRVATTADLGSAVYWLPELWRSSAISSCVHGGGRGWG